jgi:hypothetical protein
MMRQNNRVSLPSGSAVFESNEICDQSKSGFTAIGNDEMKETQNEIKPVSR